MTETTTTRKPGDRMDDGTLYAGSLDGKDLYTTPKDAPLTYTFNQAAEYAAQLNREKFLGHDDWRVPKKAELSVLFNNQAAIGGFDVSGSYPAGWYWSSEKSKDYQGCGGALRFTSKPRLGPGFSQAALRCVRG